MSGPHEPRPDWAQDRQPEPPNFGRAKLISRARLELQARWRRRRTGPIIDRAEDLCEFEPGLVSLIVLSCRRLPELRRLCETLVPFFDAVEDYPAVEKILVDNGSGPELLDYVRGLDFFDEVVAHPENLRMPAALEDAYRRCRGEYVLLVEDDFILEFDRPFLAGATEVLEQYPELGIVRLKNQNNWWKPFRRIGPLRSTSSGVRFWTWLPSRDKTWNVWAAGSVLFRKVSFFSTGSVPTEGHQNGAVLYEEVYGRRYNRTWLAAKIEGGTPFVQPNDNLPSPGLTEGATSADAAP